MRRTFGCSPGESAPAMPQAVSERDMAAADALVADLKASLLLLSGGDQRAHFALRRRALSRMKQDDDSALSRRKLQVAKYAEQGGTCAVCGLSLSRSGAWLHRRDPQAGFTVENTRLIHGACQDPLDEASSASLQR